MKLNCSNPKQKLLYMCQQCISFYLQMFIFEKKNCDACTWAKVFIVYDSSLSVMYSQLCATKNESGNEMKIQSIGNK